MRIIIILIVISVFSCRSVQYIPVEKVKTEYKDRINIQKDSVYLSDTVKIFVKGDSTTITQKRYSIVYKYIYLKDTVVSRDTIPIPYPVEVVKNKVPGIMSWLIIILSACSVPFILKIIRFIRGKI